MLQVCLPMYVRVWRFGAGDFRQRFALRSASVAEALHLNVFVSGLMFPAQLGPAARLGLSCWRYGAQGKDFGNGAPDLFVFS